MPDHRTNKERTPAIPDVAAAELGDNANIDPYEDAKAIRQQALTAERVAFTINDAVLADQMRNLAQAFRVQADTMKKNKKKNKKK
jgi:hypothetical protein